MKFKPGDMVSCSLFIAFVVSEEDTQGNIKVAIPIFSQIKVEEHQARYLKFMCRCNPKHLPEKLQSIIAEETK